MPSRVWISETSLDFLLICKKDIHVTEKNNYTRSMKKTIILKLVNN